MQSVDIVCVKNLECEGDGYGRKFAVPLHLLGRVIFFSQKVNIPQSKSPVKIVGSCDLFQSKSQYSPVKIPSQNCWVV